MLRHVCFVLTLGTVVSAVGTAQAQQGMPGDAMASANFQPAAPVPPRENWWQRWKRDYHRNQCWPEPFIAGDRAAVSMPFQIQTDNAWQRQNLLCSYHFVEGTSELNDAGQYRLRWIIFKAPSAHRQVYIERLANEKATAERVAAVQKAVVHLAPGAPPLPLYESNLGPGEWSGESADAVQRAAAKTWPEPRLPTATRATISN